MNDISNASKLLYTILFADDTSVFLEETEYSKLIETVNQEVNKVTIWFYTTHLSSHISFIVVRYGVISKPMGTICKMKQYLDRTTLKNLYYTFVFTYLIYYCEHVHI